MSQSQILGYTTRKPASSLLPRYFVEPHGDLRAKRDGWDVVDRHTTDDRGRRKREWFQTHNEAVARCMELRRKDDADAVAGEAVEGDRSPSPLRMTDLDLEGLDSLPPKPLKPWPLRLDSIAAYEAAMAAMVEGIGSASSESGDEGNEFPALPDVGDDLESLEDAYEVSPYEAAMRAYRGDPTSTPAPLADRLNAEANNLEAGGEPGPLSRHVFALMLRELASDVRHTDARTVAEAFDRSKGDAK